MSKNNRFQNARRKMCEHCAFRDNSVEMNVPDKKEHLIGECLHRVFYCHETMHQINSDDSKWLGNFDPEKKRDGTKACASDHQVCAGFLAMFGDEFGYDASHIPLENHIIVKMKG